MAVLSVDGENLCISLFEQEVCPLQVIQVLLDREEDANNVCRLNQLANCADGLRARVEMDAIVP